MKKNYFIYKLTAPNGKVYIGQSLNIKRRFNVYKNLACKTQPKLYSSLVKYGWDNFKKEILFYGNVTQKEINEIETNYISQYLKNGLNLSLKGNGGNGKFGKTHHASKPILQIDFNFNIVNEFTCGLEVEKILNFKQSCISKACRTDNPKTYNYYWRFKENYKKEDLINLVNNHTHLNSISIFQLDKNTNKVIKEWKSQQNASKTLNINQANIWRALKDNTKSAGGFKWIYAKKINYEN